MKETCFEHMLEAYPQIMLLSYPQRNSASFFIMYEQGGITSPQRSSAQPAPACLRSVHLGKRPGTRTVVSGYEGCQTKHTMDCCQLNVRKEEV